MVIAHVHADASVECVVLSCIGSPVFELPPGIGAQQKLPDLSVILGHWRQMAAMRLRLRLNFTPVRGIDP